MPDAVLAEIRLDRYRCFDTAALEPGPGLNLIVGGNAAGKTSLLEAVFILGRGSSFRAARAESAVQFNAPQATLFARLADGAVSRIGVEIHREGGVLLRVDGVDVNRGDLASAVPVQLLDPSTQEVIGGAPAARRQFMDWGTFHVEPAFLSAWQRYRRALRQRNAALKARLGAAAWAWDEGLIQEGELVDQMRRETLARMSADANALALRLLDLPVETQYYPGWPADASFREGLVSRRQRDLQLGTTTVGPHRADLRLTIAHRSIREIVSRGQEKLLTAALAVAQVGMVATVLKRPVILLVDEPAADLDQQHLARLLEVLDEAPAQIFVTALDRDSLPINLAARQFHVERGAVRALL